MQATHPLCSLATWDASMNHLFDTLYSLTTTSTPKSEFGVDPSRVSRSIPCRPVPLEKAKKTSLHSYDAPLLVENMGKILSRNDDREVEMVELGLYAIFFAGFLGYGLSRSGLV